MYLKWMISEKIETNSKKDTPPPKKKVILEQTSGHYHECGVVPVLNTCDEICNNQLWED